MSLRFLAAFLFIVTLFKFVLNLLQILAIKYSYYYSKYQLKDGDITITWAENKISIILYKNFNKNIQLLKYIHSR